MEGANGSAGGDGAAGGGDPGGIPHTDDGTSRRVQMPALSSVCLTESEHLHIRDLTLRLAGVVGFGNSPAWTLTAIALAAEIIDYCGRGAWRQAGGHCE